MVGSVFDTFTVDFGGFFAASALVTVTVAIPAASATEVTTAATRLRLLLLMGISFALRPGVFGAPARG